RNRNAGLQSGELEARRRLAGDVLEVGRLPADDAAERDDGDVTARLREGHRAERQLERTGYRHDGDVLAVDTGPVELREGRLEQAVRHIAVEAGQHDRDALPRSHRRAFDEIDVARDVERTRRVARQLLGRLEIELGLLRRRGLDGDLGRRRLARVLALVPRL